MAKKLSNTKKVLAIKDILDERLPKSSVFDLVYILKDIAAIVYDMTPEQMAEIENNRKNK